MYSDVALNRRSVVTRPLSMIPSVEHPECGVSEDLPVDWIIDI